MLLPLKNYLFSYPTRITQAEVPSKAYNLKLMTSSASLRIMFLFRSSEWIWKMVIRIILLRPSTNKETRPSEISELNHMDLRLTGMNLYIFPPAAGLSKQSLLVFAEASSAVRMI